MPIRLKVLADIAMAKQTFIAGHVEWQWCADVVEPPLAELGLLLGENGPVADERGDGDRGNY
jgi:hypothetical protein